MGGCANGRGRIWARSDQRRRVQSQPGARRREDVLVAELEQLVRGLLHLRGEVLFLAEAISDAIVAVEGA